MCRNALLLCVLFLVLATACAASLLAAGCGARRDQCDPRSHRVRCGERPGTFRACVRVDGDDYLLGIAREHFEVETVTCPGAAPLCIEEAGGRGVCRAK